LLPIGIAVPCKRTFPRSHLDSVATGFNHA
jgi:hypothetical protein